MQKTTLIIGANSEIAKALALQLQPEELSHLIVISRNIDFYQQDKFKQSTVIPIENYQESSIQEAVLRIQQSGSAPIGQIFICHGLLHSEHLQPEKKLQDFNAENFSEVISVNTITPMLWLKSLVPILHKKMACKMVFFNARVGSISDNKLGGWYSYRASKASLNMLLKSAAIELARSDKQIKLISFHPGTTDSPLSKPFQKNVPLGKLFNPAFTAQQLLTIVEQSEFDAQVSYVDWKGSEIPW